MDNHFGDRLAAAVRRMNNPVCVGLDPRWEQLPESVRGSNDDSWATRAAAYERFCCGVIDAVAPLVPVVKPQVAFFEELGPVGMVALGGVIVHAQECGLLVIIDGKRNDIGSTAEAYARAYLGRGSGAWSGDAIKV